MIYYGAAGVPNQARNAGKYVYAGQSGRRENNGTYYFPFTSAVVYSVGVSLGISA
ncbi:MAG TPA: hypothetical protein VF599_14255 [Pyrinomonadaceae bacterium]